MNNQNLKIIFLVFTILSMGGLSFFSCEKENIQVYDNAASDPITEVTFRSEGSALIDALPFDGEMFSFESLSHLEAVESYLTEEVALYNEVFSEQYTDMEDKAYNDMLKEIDFDEFQVLKDFEAEFGISSKRQQMDALVQEWISQLGDEITMDDFPDNFPFQGAVIRSLFNENGQARVAGEVLQIEDTESAAAGMHCVKRNWNSGVWMEPHNYYAILEIGSVFTIFNFPQRASSRTISLARGTITPFAWRLYRISNLESTITGTFRNSSCQQQISSTGFSKTKQGLGRRSIVTARHTNTNSTNRRFIPYSCDIEARGKRPQSPLLTVCL